MSKSIVCSENFCVGCNACVNICPKNAIKIVDDKLHINAYIDEEKCVDCGLCKKVCQQNNSVTYNNPIAWYQGWTNDEATRIQASSGGFASTAANYFFEKEYAVFTCTLNNGKFIYRKIADKKDFKKCIGSKYVKSDTDHVYSQIRKELASGQKVLFIGLPCHIQGLKLFVGEELQDNLLNIDLICHGTPSFELYKKYLDEKGIELELVQSISFRQKTQYTDLIPSGYEYWLAPFLRGLNYTKNCYHCKFACKGRVSDITIGDSWGTTLSIIEKNKGVSLIICNTEKGIFITKLLDFHLEDVDVKRAIYNNKQLIRSTDIPKERSEFEAILSKTGNYHKAVRSCYRKAILKTKLKQSFVGQILKKALKRNADLSQVKIAFYEHVER